MITLDYQLSPSWNAKTREADLGSLDEMSIRYQVLLGDIILKANAHDFSAKWGWIPIVDFAASLRHIAGQLAERDNLEATFDFTESDAVLRFKRTGDTVQIATTYAPGEAHVSLSEFTAAVAMFSRRVAYELSQQYPALRQNKVFKYLLPEGES